MSDLTFNGGASGASIGNQQYTMKNFTFNDCKTAIIQIWNWGWTYLGLSINNCEVGIDMSSGWNDTELQVGSVTVLDSKISNTGTFLVTGRTEASKPATAGGILLENIELDQVPIAVGSADGGEILKGGSTTIAAWGQGHRYTPNGPEIFQEAITPSERPQGLLEGNKYYAPSKPQYEDLTADDFMSARDAGATGDGKTDDVSLVHPNPPPLSELFLSPLANDD